MIRNALTFDPVTHTYNRNGIDYISNTKLLDMYKKPFDTEYWSEKKAKEYGTSQEQVKREWKKLNEVACETGHQTHKFIEDTLRANMGSSIKGESNDIVRIPEFNLDDWNDEIDIELFNKYPVIYNDLSILLKYGYKIFAEKRVYNDKYAIAGTIDTPIVDFKNKNFAIFDWKTNADTIRFESGYYKKVNKIRTNIFVPLNKWLLSPIDNYPDSKGWLYSFQVNIYIDICLRN